MPTQILIVDDVEPNLLAIEATLSPLGCAIVRAHSGEEALKILLTEDFAVILLDVQMPTLDGFQTAALIRGRKRSREVPIIFVTAHDEDFRQARRAYELGAFDYISKPFDQEILRTKVRGYIKLQEQANQLRVRDVAVAVLGHDLRSPLTAVKLVSERLKRAEDIPEHHLPRIERILHATSRMEKLISDMLDFTRVELGGGMVVRRERMSLASLARQIVEEASLKHANRSVQLIAEDDAVGNWDPVRLGQVVANLVGNALEHSSMDPIMVRIQSDSTTARIAVSNEGLISEPIRDRLFEPFQRGDDSPGGLGLGLYIVRHVALAHGGTANVHCDEDANETKFIVELPRAPSS